jgi:hypothetical protein
LRFFVHCITGIALPVILLLTSSLALGSNDAPQNFEEAVHFCGEKTGLQAIEYCSRVINVLKDGAPSTKKLLVSVYERRIYLYSIERELENYMARACQDVHAILDLDAYLTPEKREHTQGLAELCGQQGH